MRRCCSHDLLTPHGTRGHDLPAVRGPDEETPAPVWTVQQPPAGRTRSVSLPELHLALLLNGPAHGYEVKQTYDRWFPAAKPLAFGQVYATLARLVRDGLAEVAGTQSDGGPERTVYTVTEAGKQRLRTWLSEPAPPTVTGTEDLVRKTITALRTYGSPSPSEGASSPLTAGVERSQTYPAVLTADRRPAATSRRSAGGLPRRRRPDPPHAPPPPAAPRR
jgi:DNA-binding PadR family transcriptional regulator